MTSSNILTQLRSGGMRSTFQIFALFLSVVFLNASSAGSSDLNLALSALGSEASQGSTYSDPGGDAKNAIDGVTSGVWGSGEHIQHSDKAKLGNWWQVDLTQVDKINKIKIHNRTGNTINRLINFYVFISKDPFLNTDGTTENTAISRAGIEAAIRQMNTNGGHVYYMSSDNPASYMAPYTNSTTLGTNNYTGADITEISVTRGFVNYELDLSSANVEGRYVRVQLVGNPLPTNKYTNRQLHMAEVEVFGGPRPLSVIKTSNKENVSVSVGQEITYVYTVKNNSRAIFNDIELSDDHRGKGTAPVPTFSRIVENVDPQTDLDTTITNGKMASIGPGDTVEFTATYTVTQDDIDLLQ